MSEILKREIRFSWHIPKTDNRPDLHFVREDITYDDGKQEPKIYLLEDFKRPVYCTKKNYQNHNDKKEFEDKDKLNVIMTTQSDINFSISKLLDKQYLAKQRDTLRASPYVYGADITSTSIIKLLNLKKNDFVQSGFSVAAFDIETNPGTDEILMATIAYKNRTHTAIISKFVKNISDPTSRIKAAVKKYLPDYDKLECEFSFHDTEVDLLKKIFLVANEWKPVFLAIWNMDFDISKILDRLKFYNVNPVDVICDQSIPRWARVCRYIQGQKKKVTASGVVKPINPSLQWHTLMSTSSFYVIDSMCVFRQLRMAAAERPSYSLDAILQEELNTQKLKFKEADEYKGIKWHLFLQENYPVEYIVYNIYDCLSMLELDIKNKDLSHTLPSFAGITDFQKFNSQVRKIQDALFIFGLERNKIIGTVGKKKQDSKEDDDDDIDSSIVDDDADENDPSNYKTLGLKGWIQLLPQNLLMNEGLQCLEEYPEIVTNIRGLTCDLDATSSYPSCTLVANVSKETCVNELISVTGITEETFREQNLSICLGNANLLEYFSVIFDLPPLTVLEEYID